ncbi:MULTISPECIES: malate synthase A [Gammaproteobacteria]|uniref:malate synthase A n=1 Tax=Gammaproteobacteria TaxID=1236 RepID=UPI000DCF6B89|nr:MULTISPECIES: malate synthase A [Gammaproteobacteria]RTE85477.1 malate synthase A [Aliidiomarina sp. B3213]TCZ89444.1 malate synthase A [Lysobacter sp. N42]
MSQSNLTFSQPLTEEYQQIFSTEACEFLSQLFEKFSPQVSELLKAREQQQAKFDAGELPDFDPDTANIRNSDWKVADIPVDLSKRHLEITGPVDRKMVINALNADVDVFMADFEDAQSPTWDGLIQGQINLRDANAGTISFTDEKKGKRYQLNPNPALLIARVRGLHLPEKHVLYNGKPVPGALVDFGLYLFHNLKQRLENGTGVYFYLPKLQHHTESAWWSEVFHFSEQYFGVPTGTLRATILIETLPAVFQMHEILHSLKEHIVGLNCGRWDYIFSYIKTLKAHPDRVLPDRQVVTMNQPFLNAYSRLLIKTCHTRGALAMGGMAAFIPSKDAEENAKILDKVKADKDLEFSNGHDGTWVAHPGLSETVRGVASQYLGTEANQLHVLREQDPEVTAKDLLEPSEGERTEAGMRTNIRVALQYIAAWLSGKGCVPIYGLMEDAATAEISRTSIWQWIKHGKTLDTGEVVTVDLFRTMLDEECHVVREEVGVNAWNSGNFVAARELLDKITTSEKLTEFLTLPGYQQL